MTGSLDDHLIRSNFDHFSVPADVISIHGQRDLPRHTVRSDLATTNDSLGNAKTTFAVAISQFLATSPPGQIQEQQNG